MVEISLSQKQQTAFNLLEDPYVVELLFGGGAGGGKSWLVCLWAVIQCRRYPGIVVGLARKEVSNLGKTTALTLLTEVHRALGVQASDFRYVSPGSVNPGVYYRNGSSIPFIDLAPAPSDPNFDRLGSLSLTHNIIEEGGEVVAKARSVFTSRKNRKLNVEYGITGKTIITCNPSQNFVRDQFYEPWLALGGGSAQTWEYQNNEGEPALVEVDGKQYPAKRAFVRSLPTDNPFVSDNYLEVLKSLPPAERRRLLKGDWDFDDDDAKLFKVHLFRTVPEQSDGEAYAGCDPSRGGDKCVFSALKGNTVVDQEVCEIPRGDKDLDIGTYVAQRYITFCQSRGIGYARAAVDAVGIGVSVLDACNRLDFHIQAYNAGSTFGLRRLGRNGNVVESPRPEDEAQTTPLFNNIRSQVMYDMAESANKGELVFLESLPYYTELKRDLGDHFYEVVERQVIVESKRKMKPRTGRSPDYADSLQAAWWLKSQASGPIDEPTDMPSSQSDPISSGLLDMEF